MCVCVCVGGGSSVVLIGGRLTEVNCQHINYTIGKCAIWFFKWPPLEDVKLIFMIRSLLCIFNLHVGGKNPPYHKQRLEVISHLQAHLRYH